MADENVVEGAKHTLTKRVGPLPVWGWGAVVVGGIVVFMIIRKKSSATSTNDGTGGFFGNTTAGGGGGGSGGVVSGNQGGGTSASPGGGGTYDIPDIVLPHDTVQPLTTEQVTNPDIIPAHIGVTDGLSYTRGVQTVEGAAKSLSAGVATQARTIQQGGGLVSGTYGSAAENQRAASQLQAQGFTAGVYGGQVYAARTPQEYWNGLTPAQQSNLAKLIVATGAHT